MKPSLAISAVVLAVAATAGGAAAALGSASAKPAYRTTSGAIEAVAMDGRRIAYDVAARDAGCNRVHVWDTLTRKDVVVSGAGTCSADSTSTGAGVRELAISGNRVSWIVNLGGNTESTDTLYTVVLGATKERTLASVTRTGDVDGELNGGRLNGLHGDAGLTVVNLYVTKAGTILTASIRRVGGGLAAIHMGLDSLRIVGIDSGRIAVLGADGVVSVFDARGAKLSSFTPSVAPKEIAMRKDFVVALLPGGKLEIHSTLTGALLDTVPITPGARDLDVHANIATYAIGRSVRAIRLSGKKEIKIATAPKAIADLALDDAGLAYADNPITGVDGVGKLAFVPLSLVQAKLTAAETCRTVRQAAALPSTARGC